MPESTIAIVAGFALLQSLLTPDSAVQSWFEVGPVDAGVGSSAWGRTGASSVTMRPLIRSSFSMSFARI